MLPIALSGPGYKHLAIPVLCSLLASDLFGLGQAQVRDVAQIVTLFADLHCVFLRSHFLPFRFGPRPRGGAGS